MRAERLVQEDPLVARGPGFRNVKGTGPSIHVSKYDLKFSPDDGISAIVLVAAVASLAVLHM
jgi:hypothetical protein